LTLVSGKNSSKVSKDSTNSPKDGEALESDGVDSAKVDDAESSETKDSENPESDDAEASEGEGLIEGAEVITEDGDASDTLSDETAVDETAPEVLEVAEAISSPAPPPEPSGPSTVGLIFGGLIAGAIGFLVATFAVPEGWPNPPAGPNEAMQAELDSQAGQIAALESQIADIGAVPISVEADLTPVQDEIAGLSERIDALSGDLAAASARIEALENSPAAVIEAAPSVDFGAEMETFRAELEAAAAAARAEVEAAQARAEQIEADAAAAAEMAMQRAALAQVSAALESGAPFADALVDVPNVPEALAAVAEQGVPTLAGLRAEFPDAARDALRNAQSIPADASAIERIAAFLRQQTNARSLSAREGDDPDAVLSRAEATLNDGDLASTLEELSVLPEGAIASLGGWIAQAETRVAATTAVQSLTDEMN
jgi:hypothetical protein